MEGSSLAELSTATRKSAKLYPGIIPVRGPDAARTYAAKLIDNEAFHGRECACRLTAAG